MHAASGAGALTCALCGTSAELATLSGAEGDVAQFAGAAMRMFRSGDYADCASYLEEKIVNGTPGRTLHRQHAALFPIYGLLVACAERSKDYAKQRTYCDLMIECLRKASLAGHIETADALYSQADALIALAGAEKVENVGSEQDDGALLELALAALRESLEIRTTCLGPNDSQTKASSKRAKELERLQNERRRRERPVK